MTGEQKRAHARLLSFLPVRTHYRPEQVSLRGKTGSSVGQSENGRKGADKMRGWSIK